MHAVNIRQLKNNPSVALRAAKEEDMVIVMNRDNPTAVIFDLDKLGLPDTGAARVAMAIALFRNGAISVGSAARMAGKPYADMINLLGSLNIPITQGTDTNKTSNDMQRARELLSGD